MNIQNIFLNELGGIRSGWRAGLFFICLFAITAIIFGVVHYTSEQLLTLAPLLLLLSVFLATLLMIKVFEKRPIKSVGLPLHKRLPVELLHGVVISAVMISLVFLVHYALGWVEVERRDLEFSVLITIIFNTLIIFGVAGFAEELIFRGYPFQVLIESISPVIAIGIMSTAFSVAHIMNPNITLLSFFNIFLAGIWLSIAYLRTRTLWLPAGLHVSWNFFQHTIYSYPVSGQLDEQNTLMSVTVTGPELLTGGDFGPEGGLIATVVLLIGILYIQYAPHFKIGEEVWTIDKYIREQLEKLKT